MAERKWIDAREFREVGFLQEANRLFFHLHGLALAVTTVKDEPVYTVAITAEQHERLMALAADDDDLLAVIENAARYDVGDSYFQGVWDVRDDPEGVIFGDGPEDKREKAQRVHAERERHFTARCDLFAVPAEMRRDLWMPDVETVDWVAPEADDA